MTRVARTSFALLTSAMLLAGCASVGAIPARPVGQARLSFANGLPAGTVQFLADGDSVSARVSVTGLAPGQHGFHLHTVGKCEAPDFLSAGPHLNPAGKAHGTMASGGAHLGDMPNLQVGANGTATATVVLAGPRDTTLAAIFDADGTAVVIHADPDDYRTDPSGNAGKRIACGVVTKL